MWGSSEGVGGLRGYGGLSSQVGSAQGHVVQFLHGWQPDSYIVNTVSPLWYSNCWAWPQWGHKVFFVPNFSAAPKSTDSAMVAGALMLQDRVFPILVPKRQDLGNRRLRTQPRFCAMDLGAGPATAAISGRGPLEAEEHEALDLPAPDSWRTFWWGLDRTTRIPRQAHGEALKTCAT